MVWPKFTDAKSRIVLEGDDRRDNFNKTAQINLKTVRVATPCGRPIVHICSSVFVSWRQCARPSNRPTRFIQPTLLTIPNGSSIGSAVCARPMPHSPYTLHYAIPFSQKKSPLLIENLHPKCIVACAHPTHDPKRQLDRISRFSRIHGRYQRTDGQTNRPTVRRNATRSVTIGHLHSIHVLYAV